MNKKLMILGMVVTLVLGCMVKKVTKLEAPEGSVKVDLTGMSKEQQEVAKGMINEIIPLIKAGKSTDEVLRTLQDAEGKKVTRYQVEVGESPSRGPKDAKVTIIEFSDFQCPFSKKVQTTLGDIIKKYPQQVKHVYKQNPLPFHKDAPLAAEAALAAGAQGMFWEMHDIIFENQNQLKEENLLDHAQKLGLDVEKFKADLTSHKFKPQVDGELQQAAKVGASGTPAFFINGRFLSGAQPLESFVKIVDEELSGKAIPFKWGTSVKEEKKEAKRVEEDPNKIYTVPVGTSPVKGPKNAPITFIAYNDFQCPFSKRVQPTIDQLMKNNPQNVKIVFKHFPLGFHKDAIGAAEAAMAAGAQGKFWEMHDKIFANQEKISIDNLKGYAQELKLNMTKFNADLESHRFKPAIDEDTQTAGQLGVRGTPTVFVNGKKVVGAKPVEEFQKIIDEFLKK